MLESRVSALRWHEAEGELALIDQLKLPNQEEWIRVKTAEEVERAIVDMVVRGAPAIGIVAAFGVYFSSRQHWSRAERDALILRDIERLAATRPTAVNLFWALERMKKVLEAHREASSPDFLLREAQAIWAEDLAMNRGIAEQGAKAIGPVKNILTHCNAGALATSGLGTALAVIRAIDAEKRQRGERLHVWVDETRPYLQGARLTAWELMQDDIDCSLISDNMAAHFMQAGLVDAVVIGADRISKNGDVANKIGSYALAILAKYHGIPFYVAAPTSTFDVKLETGADIVIEERSAEEVTIIRGQRIAPETCKVRHPAFDVTPQALITGIITPSAVIHRLDDSQ